MIVCCLSSVQGKKSWYLVARHMIFRVVIHGSQMMVPTNSLEPLISKMSGATIRQRFPLSLTPLKIPG